MDSFGSIVKKELASQGLSMRAAARAIHYDVAYLSRVLKGTQEPSRDLTESLDELLGTGLSTATIQSVSPFDDGSYVRNTIAHLLDHDQRHGGDQVASAAVQVWRSEQRKLDIETDPTKERLSTVAELAEVSGWLLFDANRQNEAREAFIESQLLAGHAGDRPFQWFTLDLLAMQDVQRGHTGEALRIADELLGQARVPQRVTLLARMRRARALAQAGERSRALADIDAARGGLQESVTGRDPGWTWWVNEIEVAGHHGEVLMSLGEHSAALPHLQQARELVRPVGRGALYYMVAELTAFAVLGAWRDCEATLTQLAPVLQEVSSARSRERLRSTLRVVDRDGPAWLTDVAREVVDITSP
jgi:transcriptional regulator with XRE-family HTH domain